METFDKLFLVSAFYPLKENYSYLSDNNLQIEEYDVFIPPYPDPVEPPIESFVLGGIISTNNEVISYTTNSEYFGIISSD